MEIFESIKKRTSWNWCLKFFVQLVGTKFFITLIFDSTSTKPAQASTSSSLSIEHDTFSHVYITFLSYKSSLPTEKKTFPWVWLSHQHDDVVFFRNISHLAPDCWLFVFLPLLLLSGVFVLSGRERRGEREEGGKDEDEKDDDSSEGWVSRYKERICFRAQKVTAKWTTSTWNSFNFLLTLTF